MEKMNKLVVAAKRAEEETKRAEAEQERERRLRHELQENIINTAHDIKSPTTALGRTNTLSLTHLLSNTTSNSPFLHDRSCCGVSAGRVRQQQTYDGRYTATSRRDAAWHGTHDCRPDHDH